MITRRRFLATASVASASAMAPARLWAATSLAVGRLRVDSLFDGTLVRPADFILGSVPPEELAGIIARYGLSAEQLTPPCNVTLLRDGTNTVLFDAGSSADFAPTAARLPDALAALGVAREEVTHVVVTHCHPDHVWGLLDDFDDLTFPNAEVVIGAAELAYWTDPATFEAIGAARAAFVIGAQRRLEAVADRIRTIEDGEDILPGVIALATPGHTPGHISYMLRDGGDRLTVLGDCIGNHHVAFERPEWVSGSDQDADLGVATRVAMLDRLAGEGAMFIGFHLPGGGIGRAERAGAAYRFVPA